jgi:hypothetical protein
MQYTIVSARQHGKGISGEQQTKLLNECGEAGYELIAVIPQTDGDVWFYFKIPARSIPLEKMFKIGSVEKKHVDLKKSGSKH